MATSSSKVESKPTCAWLNVCRSCRSPPARAETPRNSSVVPMIEPVICACTT
ncbi:MAG TPA: hypothetical protein VJY34_02830 [Roseiarcus sp.]|nr:hypothetical protein [Roseiarcus sp.]